jgi:hypothetical protein
VLLCFGFCEAAESEGQGRCLSEKHIEKREEKRSNLKGERTADSLCRLFFFFFSSPSSSFSTTTSRL